MKRTTYCIAVAIVLIAIIVTSAYAQVQRSQVRVRRSGGQSTPAYTVPVDPNMTPQQQMAQHQQEFQQRMAEMQRQMEQMQRQAEESRNNAIRQMLNATDEQWPRIKAKLDLIDRLKGEATVSADPGSSGGMGGGGFQSSGAGFGGFGGSMGGWMSGGAGGGGGSMSASGQPQTWSQSWGSGSNRRSSANPSDGEVLCEQLIRDLRTPGVPPADIAQRVAALRKIRSQAQAQLSQARKDLRTLITPAQEPALVAMGYLD